MKALTNPIGLLFILGHNGAKQLGSQYGAYNEVRIEAVGIDWIVVRDESGAAAVGTFGQAGEHWSVADMIWELEK